MMTIGELVVQLNEEIKNTLNDPNHNPQYLENLYAAICTIRDILTKNGETEDYHIKNLDSRG